MSKYVLEEHYGEGRIANQKSELGLLIGDTKEQLECGLPMSGKFYRYSDIKEMEAKIKSLQQELNNRPSPCVNLSMEQIKSIAEFAGFAVNTFDYSDDEMKNTEFVISTSEKVDNEDGTYYEGMTAHCAEYPDEGFLTLEDTAPLPQPPTQED